MVNVAFLHQHINYNGYSAGFEVGNYTLSQLRSMNIKNDDISSIKIEYGYKITIYQHDHFQGKSLIITSHTPNLVSLNFNDIISSIVVEQISILPTKTLYENSKNASVSLLVEKSDGLYVGSGWIYKKDGEYYILTAAHVPLQGYNPHIFANKVIASMITSDGQKKCFECQHIGHAAYGDISVLKITISLPSNQAHLSFAENNPQIGEKCYVIGDPLGFDTISISDGIIRDNSYVYGNHIKSVLHSAPIYGGNSGSPVLNDAGEVIAIVSYGFADTLSFGAHFHVIKQVVDNIITTYVAQGSQGTADFIGGSIQAELYPVDSTFYHNKQQYSGELIGFYVYSTNNSQLLVDDIITSINSEELGLYDGQTIPTATYLTAKDSPITMQVKRGGALISSPPTTTTLMSDAENTWLGGGDSSNDKLAKVNLVGPIKK